MKNNNDIFDTVIKLNKVLKESDVRFAFGASVCLYLHGLDVSPNDIDIVVDKADIDKLKDAFKSYKEIKGDHSSDVFISTFFYQYEVDDYKIDVMSDFKIKRGDDIYTYPFESTQLETKSFRGESIIICPLKDWLHLYSLMPDREAKVKMIQDFYQNKNA